MAKAKIPKSPDPSHDSKVNKVDRRQTLSAVKNLLLSLKKDIFRSTARISELEQRLVIERSVSLSLRLKEAGDRLNQRRREQMKLKGGAE